MAALLPLCLCSGVGAQSGSEPISWDDALDQEHAWYASAEAVRIGDNVLLYQHANGGWPKNMDMAGYLNEEDKAAIRQEKVAGGTTLDNTTLDNGAGYTQMRYLARVYDATEHERFAEGFVRGLDWVLEAQYGNGGWPQYYPIREGYYEHITFNDGVMIGAMRLLRDVVQTREHFAYVDPDRRMRSAAAIEKGLDLILKTQVAVDGRLTAWCAQYGRDDLSCAQARSYELPSLSGAESVNVVRYLMEIEEPSPQVVRAVERAVDWLERVKLTGLRMVEKEDPSLPGGYDRIVEFDPSAPAMWARFYEIGTNRPMFVGRDGIVRYSMSEIEHERRVGYRWLGSWPRDLLAEEVPAWREARRTRTGAFDGRREGPIRPYRANPWYWQYQGEPVVLIGGTDEDNLFQWTGERLTDHLELLVSSGGNYVRNTLSDRDDGNVYAFDEIEDGVYDLGRWNDAYWDRLTFFLDATENRGIIVQLTLWDQFDLSGSAWENHPWNPQNNVNMESGSWTNRDDFYATVADGDRRGLQLQQQFVDRVLSITLDYGNVLYNINNESSEGETWENYWAQYIHRAADDAGREAYVTTMQFDPSNSVRQVMTFPDIYDFVEISQNNQDSRGARGQSHWDNIVFWRKKMASHADGPRPMNNVKVYGAKDGVNYSAGTETEAINRFWRNIFAGSASSRFHRPAEPRAWGSGLNERVQTNLKAMRMLLEEMDIFSSSPHNDLLSPRVPVGTTMDAYVTANIGRQYAVYFPPGRYTVDLDPWVYVDELQVRWLDIDRLTWSDAEIVAVRWEGGRSDWGDRGTITLTTPSNRPYVALLDVLE